MKKEVVLITGGTRGIGAAIADIFSEKGYDLVLTGTDETAIAELNKKKIPGRRYIQANFDNKESLQKLIDYIQNMRQLDVCINNAGINIIKPIGSITEIELDTLTSVNYRSPYLICQAASNVMKKQNCGKIVNIASIWSIITRKGRSLYSASKAGLAGMTRALSIDLASSKILVNCVSPGFTLTDLTHASLSSKELEKLSKEIPLGRLAKPSEIAQLVFFLGSPLNSYITGQNIIIDGGFVNV